ncbi:variant SH3 domain-containing protein [Ditylenchus destructor]|nr:variant SH3 domain-containing protein [Ditylenchus destructor]
MSSSGPAPTPSYSATGPPITAHNSAPSSQQHLSNGPVYPSTSSSYYNTTMLDGFVPDGKGSNTLAGVAKYWNNTVTANEGRTNPGTLGAQLTSDSLLLALHRSQPNTRLFRALFQYIPLRDSPNDNPHLELTLQAGDYVLVHGDMDEDAFFVGETLDGRTGLVPSNYVEQVSDTALLQNAARAPSPLNAVHRQDTTQHQSGSSVFQTPHVNTVRFSNTNNPSTSSIATKVSVATQSPPIATTRVLPPSFGEASTSTITSNSSLQNQSNVSNPGGPPDSPSFVMNVPSHYAQITHDFTDIPTSSVSFGARRPIVTNGDGGTRSGQLSLPDSVCPYPPVDVSKVTVQEVKFPDQPRVPLPRELNVEKKLSRSAVFCWLPPDDQLVPVSQYHVCVDGAVKAVVPGSYKCKALIEDLDLSRSVNVSVRSITENGQSPDAGCTISLGTEAPVAPQHVRVTNITPVSAHLYWYPSNSNAEHVLLLNGLKVGACPPGVFQVQLQGLSPSTIYRVSVRTKHPKAVLEKRPVERCVDFKTLPKTFKMPLKIFISEMCWIKWPKNNNY